MNPTMYNKDVKEVSSNSLYVSHRLTSAQKKDVFANHIHDCIELIYIVKGRFTFTAENSTFFLKENDLVFIPPHLFHFLENLDKEFERCIVQIRNASLMEYLSLDKPYKYNLKNHPELQDIFLRFDNFYKLFYGQNNEYLIRITELLFEEMLILLSQVTWAEMNENDFLLHANGNYLMDDIIEYINNNIENVRSLKQLSEHFYISVSQLNKMFSKNWHISPAKFIEFKRMVYAKTLIQKGTKPLAVSQLLGYSNYSTFFRNYKKFNDVSPTTTYKECSFMK